MHQEQVDKIAMQVADRQSRKGPGSGIAPLYVTRLVFLPPQFFEHPHLPRKQGSFFLV
jgi:hypothetical protein